jgi:hypothetical protein
MYFQKHINRDQKMKLKLSISCLVLALTMPTLSFAAGKGDGHLNPWTECGIGAMIFEDTAWAAAISNVIWDLGTKATSTTSSSPGVCSGDTVKVAAFINETYNNVAEETARGSGDHVVTALNILGCDSAAHNDIATSLRSDFSVMVQNPTYASQSNSQKAEAYYFNLMNKVEGKFSQQCSTS